MAWKNESMRHSLASRGIKTAQKINPVVLDLNKYLGKWYEVGRLPNWFQESCRCAIAEYSKKQGKIEVKNSCYRDGERDFRYADAYKTKGKKDQLDVYFNPFIKGEYQVLYVDKKYNTAIVGTPSKKVLWFLSRDKKVSDSKIKKLKEIAKEKGYNNLSRMRIDRHLCKK